MKQKLTVNANVLQILALSLEDKLSQPVKLRDMKPPLLYIMLLNKLSNIIIAHLYQSISPNLIPFHKKPDTNTDPVETRYIASLQNLCVS